MNQAELKKIMDDIDGGQCHCEGGVCMDCEDCGQCRLFQEIVKSGGVGRLWS